MWLAKVLGGTKCKQLDLFLGNVKLDYCQEYKYHVIVFDQRLTMKSCINIKLNQCKARNKMVFRMSGLVKRGLRSLWRGYVELFLFYGLPTIYPLLCDSRREKIEAFYLASARKIAGVCQVVLKLLL